MRPSRLFLFFIFLAVLSSSVSASYYIDVYTDSMTEASFNNNGVTIHKLNDNVWRLNSTLTDYADQRASVIKVFYDNYLSAGNITRIEVSNATDIDKRALFASVDISFPSGGTGPRAIIIDTDVNFTTPGNVSSWYYLSTQTNAGMGTGGGSISTYSVDGSEVESISSNGIGASSIETTYYEDNYVNDTPVSTNLYTFLRVTTSSNTIGRTMTRALYFTESDAVRTYTQSSSGFVSVNTNSFIDYYANYSIPKFNSTTLLVSALNNYPLNNTPLNQSTNLSYNLYHVDGFANCSIYVNGVFKEEVTGQSSGSNTIYYNTSYGTEGSNLVNISCVDDINTAEYVNYFFVDTISPEIEINYTTGGVSSSLSDVFFNIEPEVNISVVINDTHLGYVQVNITNTAGLVNSDTITNLTSEYVYNYTLDFSTAISGLYTVTVVARDTNGVEYINTYSDSANFTYSYISLNITIYDYDTLEKLTGTNFTVQYIGTGYQSQKTTTTGEALFNVSFAEYSDDVNLVVFATTLEDYSIVNRVFTLFQGLDRDIEIYMTNTSGTNTARVTYQVFDGATFERLSGAIVTILKRNPATGNDITITQLTTNSYGEASVVLITDSVFYKQIVTYESETVYVSPSYSTISPLATTIPIRVNLDTAFNEYMNTLYETSADITYINITSNTARLSVLYSSDYYLDYCFYLYNTSIGSYTLREKLCGSGTSGTFTTGVISVTNKTEFISYFVIDNGDGEGNRTIQTYYFEMGKDLTEAYLILEEDGLFIPVILVVVSWFGFLVNPVAGLVGFSISMIVVYMLGITTISKMTITSLIILALFSITVISRRTKT